MKKVLSILVILAVVVGGYFIFQKVYGHKKVTSYDEQVKQDSTKDETVSNVVTENKEKCLQQGEGFLGNQKQSDGSRGVRSIFTNEEYSYNNSLQTCLTYFESVEEGEGTTYSIIDIMKNKRLYVFYDFENKDGILEKMAIENCKIEEGCIKTKEDFIAKYEQLFK
jgi:hypothetical protein